MATATNDAGRGGEAKAAIPKDFDAQGFGGSTLRKTASQRGRALQEEGETLYDQGKVDEAMSKWQEALKVKTEESDDSYEAALILNNIATVHVKRHEYDLALEYYKKALVRLKRELGNDACVATALFNTGVAHEENGDREKAEACFKEALLIYDISPGNNQVDTADPLYCIGRIYFQKEEYELALDCNRKALNIREAALGSGHIDIAKALNNIGSAHKKLGDDDTAEKCFDRALGIVERTYGRNHLEVASLLSNLAGVYNNTSRHGKALIILEEASTIRKSLLGQEHRDVGQIYWELGSAFVQNNEMVKGLSSWNEALCIQRRALGDHQDTAQTLYFMGLVQSNVGHPVKAILCYEEALVIYRAIGRDDDDSRVASIIGNLEVLRKKRGKATCVSDEN